MILEMEIVGVNYALDDFLLLKQTKDNTYTTIQYRKDS